MLLGPIAYYSTLGTRSSRYYSRLLRLLLLLYLVGYASRLLLRGIRPYITSLSIILSPIDYLVCRPRTVS